MPDATPKPKRGPISSHLRRTFITGLVFLAPVAVTAGVLYMMFKAVDELLGPYFTKWVGFHIPGLGILATVLLVYVIGLIASNVAGQRLIHMWDAAVTRVPLVRGLYRVTKDVSQAFQSDRRPFRRVVAIEFPRAGLWTLGFVTADVQEGVPVPAGSVYVFVPTTPNPTSGWLILVPESEVRETGYSVDEGMRVIISAGIVGPPPP